MVRVPSVGLSPISRPQFQAPGVVAFQGTGESQQAARDAQRLGQVGSFLSAVGREAEDKVNNARAREFANTFENGVNKALFTYEQTKGKDGVTGLEAFNKEIEEIYQGASGMLMNDTQRQAAAPIVDKIRNRASLRSQAHYAKTAAEDEQAQNLAGQALLRDQMIAAPDDPESLQYFARFNNLVSQEVDALGLEGDARTVFELSKRDKLFQDVVTQGLDSQDPQKIAAIKNLMESVPDGVISSTQKASLNQLVRTKSNASDAIQFAAQAASDGKSFSEGFRDILETAKTNPDLAAKQLTEWSKFAAAQDKAEAEERGDLLQELSKKIADGLSLTANDETRAKEAGILDSLRIQEARLDVTDDYGERILNELNRRPSAIIAKYGDDEGTVARMVDDLKAHVSQERLLALTGQYNAYKNASGGGRTGSRAGGSDKFNQFSVSNTTITDVVLRRQDSLAAAESDGKTFEDKLRSKYGKGESSARTRALQVMENNFHMAVIKSANERWQTLTEQERNKTNEVSFIEKVAKDVYESGWVDQEHTRNIYTTEFRYGKPGEDLDPLARPMRRDELEPFQAQAMQELIQEEREAAIQRSFDQTIPGNLVMNQQAFEERANQSVLGIVGLSPAVLSEREARKARASSTISPADIDARAEALRQKSADQAAQTDEERFVAVTNDITRKLASTQYQNIDLSDGQRIEFKKWFGGAAMRDAKGPEGRRQLWLQSLGGLRDEWFGSGTDGTWTDARGDESTWEDLSLLFYPGNERDLPGSVRSNLQEIRRMYSRSGDMPDPVPDKRGRITIAGGKRVRQTAYKNLNEIPRFEALRWYFSRPGRQQ